MAAPRNDQIQAALVAKLKATPAIYSLLHTPDFPTGTPNEIREDQWQGDEFEYPNIRVRMIGSTPDGDTAECNRSMFTASIMVFSQEYSSFEPDNIAGIISSSLHGKSFSANNLALFLRTTNLIPAVRSDIRTWRSECLVQGEAAT